MDKAVLKKFAIESRQDLMQRMENKIKTFYIDEEFSKQQSGDVYILANSKHSLNLSKEEYTKRELLIKRINELGLDQVIEEAAYTWFNRIVAIRYMEIHDYLPLTRDNQSLGIRVLSSKDNTPDPEIMKFTNLVNSELDIDFKKEKYVEIKDDNEKFKYILLLVCKKLGRVMPQVFDGVTDYIDILIPDNLLNESGYIAKILKEIPEENYKNVEIIGWLYQYYISEKHEEVIDSIHGKVISKEEIPAATQLFTSDWVVKYLVDNSVGRYWIERNLESNLDKELKYYVYSKNKEKMVTNEKCIPKDVTIFDPCVGSGHFLVYAFDVLMKIYKECGYSEKDATIEIVNNNIYGLDIDGRATQLAYFSVMMKARSYDRYFFSKDIQANIFEIIESNDLDKKSIEYFCGDDLELKNDINVITSVMHDAKEYGSILNIPPVNWEKIDKRFSVLSEEINIYNYYLFGTFKSFLSACRLMSKKYAVVDTNPPYLNKYDNKLKEYINKYYPKYKGDLFSVFMIRNFDYCKSNGLSGFMTPNVWMFISLYEELRKYIVQKKNICTLIQMAKGAFFKEATVDVCAFILENKNSNIPGIYFRLEDFKGDMDVQGSKFLDILNNYENDYIYEKAICDFLNIPGNLIAYWASNKIINAFSNKKISEFAISNGQNITGNNNKYIRLFWEVDKNNINENYWVKCARGGGYRKYYGNDDNVILWTEEARNHYKRDNIARIISKELRFREGITWSYITSSIPSFRKLWDNELFEKAGTSIFIKDSRKLLPLLGLLNSVVALKFLSFINPTINYQVRDIFSIPIILDIFENNRIIELVNENIEITKSEWDSYETSWDFQKHPLINYDMHKDTNTIKKCYLNWEKICNERFEKLKRNEEELNKIFIDIYELSSELKDNLDDKNSTIKKANKEREVKSLISYAIGCMFGRYSLNKGGLIYAGGNFDMVYQKYKKNNDGLTGECFLNYKFLNDNGNKIKLSFEVDNDNIIPITDEAYFSDDIVQRFKQFIEVAFGKETLNENLDFVAETLGKKGTETSEETIRRYFVNDFFNDHCKIYQKRPIYWLLDSGKKNGFKALIYMHRYNENLIPKVRLDYLHIVQTTYDKLLSDINYKLTTDLSIIDKKEALKRQADLNAKLQEIKEYDEKIAHIANQRISIDLDDGVKTNYEKFKDILAKIK